MVIFLSFGVEKKDVWVWRGKVRTTEDDIVPAMI